MIEPPISFPIEPSIVCATLPATPDDDPNTLFVTLRATARPAAALVFPAIRYGESGII